MVMNYDSYYKDKLEQGLEYQDFVADVLYEIGLPIFNYNSKKYQIAKGENKLGIEIKFDNMFSNTGNFWIEVQEKSNPNNTHYVDSGIFRHDNTWLYVIGNYEVIYIFAKKHLQEFSRKSIIIENSTKTSRGFLLNKTDADRLSIKHLTNGN